MTEQRSCPNCRLPVDVRKHICHHCGREMAAAAPAAAIRFCANCESAIAETDARFCPDCGSALGAPLQGLLPGTAAPRRRGWEVVGGVAIGGAAFAGIAVVLGIAVVYLVVAVLNGIGQAVSGFFNSCKNL